MRKTAPAPERVRSVLVLGGTSDIGVAIAARLRRDGPVTVALAGRRPDALEQAAGRLRALGAEEARVHTLEFDALRPESHDEVVGRAAELLGGGIDVVVVALGVLGDRGEDQLDPVAAARVGATNYVGAMSATLAASGRLREQGRGTIVVVSSVAGVRVRRSNFVYGSSKAAIDAFAQGLGDALHGSGVRVVIVRPGFVATKMTAGLAAVPLSTSVEAVAEATVGAIGSGRRITWSPASFRLLFLVFNHLPQFVWRRLPL